MASSMIAKRRATRTQRATVAVSRYVRAIKTSPYNKSNSSSVGKMISSIEHEMLDTTWLNSVPLHLDKNVYDLIELLENERVQFSDSGCSGEDLAKKLFESIIDSNDFAVLANREAPLKILPSFLSSTVTRPDVAVYFNDIPILFGEVQSGNYPIDSLRKLVLNTCDLFRYLSHYIDDLDHVTGFFIPKKNVPKKCVKLEMKFEWLRYVCNFKILEKDEIRHEMKTAVDHMKVLRYEEPPPDLFFHLLPSYILMGCFGERSVQLESYHSLVIQNYDEIYKIMIEKNNLFDVVAITGRKLLHSLLPERKCVVPLPPPGCVSYYVFSVLNPPYSRSQAKEHLPWLIIGIVIAINELHDFGIAHLDIRLENICFRTNNDVILIDLDRMDYAHNVFSSKYEASCMYPTQLEPKYTNAQVDWIQLGYLILWLLNDEELDYHSMTRDLLHTIVGLKCYSFVETLIKQG